MSLALALRATSRRLGVLHASLAVAIAVGIVPVSCGGTTGLPPSPSGTSPGPADATSAETSTNGDATLPASTDGDDGTVGDDGVDFDAGIQYADPDRLNGFVAPDAASDTVSDAGTTQAGPTAGSQWPACAQDMYTLHREVPDDAGPCLTYEWTPTFGPGCGDAGNNSNPCLPCDQCLRKSHCGVGGILPGSFGVLPPCSDLREAGTAAHGNGAGKPLFDLCAALFDCVTKKSCTCADPTDPNASPSNCYCGTNMGTACVAEGGANGVCRKEIEEAVQASPSTSPVDILANLTDLSNPMGLPGSHAGTEVMALVNCAVTADCKRCFTSNPDGG